MLDPLFCLISAVAVVSIGLNVVMCRAYDGLATMQMRQEYRIDYHDYRLANLEVSRRHADVFSTN